MSLNLFCRTQTSFSSSLSPQKSKRVRGSSPPSTITQPSTISYGSAFIKTDNSNQRFPQVKYVTFNCILQSSFTQEGTEVQGETHIQIALECAVYCTASTEPTRTRTIFILKCIFFFLSISEGNMKFINKYQLRGNVKFSFDVQQKCKIFV